MGNFEKAKNYFKNEQSTSDDLEDLMRFIKNELKSKLFLPIYYYYFIIIIILLLLLFNIK